MKIPNKDEIRKPSKTLAGVTPIAVMCKPKKCKHGTCIYCPSLNVPQSYTPKSPPVLRAERLRYDSYEQVLSRLKAFEAMNHPTSKIELIIMGGNFMEFSIAYQRNFIKKCYDALNGRKSKNLADAKKKNEKAKHRCVALCIETRPDTCGEKEIKRMLEFGCTRVELGVQCLDDKIYKKINRGHCVREVIDATKQLRNYGFKIGYHIMLGLPGSNIKKDYAMFRKLFSDERFKPDQLKIYPCQVIKGAVLEKWYKQGKYKPYSQKQIEKLLEKIMLIVPNYCRIMRIMREIPPDYLTAGIHRIDLRRDFESALKSSKLKNKIHEIRFREIGFAVRDNIKISKNIRLKITKYNASSGDEYFLEIVNRDNILFGLLRLRVYSRDLTRDLPRPPALRSPIHLPGDGLNNKNRTAIVRELHVYGKTLDVGEKSEEIGQHSGFGKMLLKKAEEIVKKEKIKELSIISGVGVREYYRRFCYKVDDRAYMVKRFD